MLRLVMVMNLQMPICLGFLATQSVPSLWLCLRQSYIILTQRNTKPCLGDFPCLKTVVM